MIAPGILHSIEDLPPRLLVIQLSEVVHAEARQLAVDGRSNPRDLANVNVNNNNEWLSAWHFELMMAGYPNTIILLNCTT